MGYIYRLLIRKNTLYIRNKLEGIGYTYAYILRDDADYITTTKYGNYYIEPANYVTPDGIIDSNAFIDCGTNENLFLALAALRDDNDYMQWFCHKSGAHWIRLKEPYMTFSDYYQLINEDKDLDVKDWHKATLNEIFKYFC